MTTLAPPVPPAVQMRLTRVYRDNVAAFLGGKRRAFNEGGTSSSKTFSILQLLTLVAQSARRPLVVSVVAESLPHLKRGCLRDWIGIMGPAFDGSRFNRTESIYRFPNGTVMEFFPADDPSKMRGGRRDILFINEANNVAYDAYRELDIRTRLFTFADWNPVSEFWFHRERLQVRPENAYIHSTYQDALSVLPPEVVANIESNRDGDPNWWNVYGLGRVGRVEGLVYPAFSQEDELPEGGRSFYGLDFGFSTDPTALVKCVLRDDALHCQELIYERNLTNPDIAARMEALGLRKGYDEIWADSAEPKSIEEIHRLGWNVQGAGKGPDSVEYGHQLVRHLKQFWTQDSLNAIKEQRNFTYIRDKDGRLTAKTQHAFSHAMDARRYGVMGAVAYTGAWRVL